VIDPSLKVLFCAFQVVPEPSGASARTTEFLRALQGLCVVDALTAKSPDVGHIERYLGARLMRVPVGAGDLAARSQAFERAVVRQLDSDEYQIIQFSDPFAGAALLDLKAKLHFKLVYDAATFPSFDLRYTDPHLEGDRSFMTKLKRDELLCLMGADAVLTGSTVKRDHIVSLGVPRQRITVIPPLVDLKPFVAFAGSRPDRIPMRLLYMGSQVAWQGLPTLLFALKDALKNPAAGGCRLSILGPRHPDWRDQLEQQVQASGMAGNVDFLDPVPRDELPPAGHRPARRGRGAAGEERPQPGLRRARGEARRVRGGGAGDHRLGSAGDPRAGRRARGAVLCTVAGVGALGGDRHPGQGSDEAGADGAGRTRHRGGAL
jgi:glycosyltransferase involved in cell wall biosynthesis